MLIKAIVERIRIPAFACDPEGTILAWNGEAERLFARRAQDAVGRRCHKLLTGLDEFGNDFCCADCAVWRMARQDRLVHPFRIHVKDGRGRTLGVRVSILKIVRSDGSGLIHLLDAVVESSVSARHEIGSSSFARSRERHLKG